MCKYNYYIQIQLFKNEKITNLITIYVNNLKIKRKQKEII